MPFRGSEPFKRVVDRSVGRVRRDGHGELDAVLLTEALQPVQELLHRHQVAGAGDLAQVVHENVGNIVIARIQTADKATQALKRIHGIFAGVHQTNVIADVIGHVGAGFHADDAAVLRLHSVVDQVDELLGLTGPRLRP